jgi:hypothetical protein
LPGTIRSQAAKDERKGTGGLRISESTFPLVEPKVKSFKHKRMFPLSLQKIWCSFSSLTKVRGTATVYQEPMPKMRRPMSPLGFRVRSWKAGLREEEVAPEARESRPGGEGRRAVGGAMGSDLAPGLRPRASPGLWSRRKSQAPTAHHPPPGLGSAFAESNLLVFFNINNLK